MHRFLPLGLLVAACGHRGAPAGDAAASAPPADVPALAHGRLGDDADVAALEERYLERLRKAPTLTCTHPLARDPASSEAGDDLRRVLGLDTSEVTACENDLVKLGDVATTNLATCDPDPDGAGPGKRVCIAPPLAPAATEITDLLQHCGAPLRAALAAAAGHADACSPWLPGRAPAANLVGLVRAGNLAMLDARALARTGDPVGAIEELIDVLSVAQDLMRQGDLVPAITAIAVTPRVIATAERIVADVDLPPGGADRIAGELDRLIAAAPDWSDATASEDLAEMLAIAWPWRDPYVDPPGGARAPQAKPTAALGGATPRDLYGAELLAIEKAAKERADACDGKPIAACEAAIRKLDPGTPPMGEEAKQTLVSIALQSPRAPGEVRATLVGQLSAALHDHLGGYVDLFALRLGQLAALRLEVELVRHGGRACPDDAALAAANAIAPLARFGEDIALSRRDQTIVVRAADGVVAIALRCGSAP